MTDSRFENLFLAKDEQMVGHRPFLRRAPFESNPNLSVSFELMVLSIRLTGLISLGGMLRGAAVEILVYRECTHMGHPGQTRQKIGILIAS